MSITDWINEELYPSLYDSIDIALPEHNFKRRGDGWYSNTYLDGSPHKRADKTKVKKAAPWCIFEEGGDIKGLVNYVEERDSVDFIQAVRTLADVAGVNIPKGEVDKKAYQKHRDKATILEEAQSYFVFCLEKSANAEEIRAYLASRGYSREDIEKMGLGYIPSQEQLRANLQKRGHKDTLIDETIKLHKAIGDTHTLTIPFRSRGRLEGFVVRAIEDNPRFDTGHNTGGYSIKLRVPKYLLSAGLKRGESFFNISALKGDKDLVVVEGYLDALIAEARGVENVVALGGAKVTRDQVQDAIKRGAKSFTLCLDTDEAGRERVDKAIGLILEEGGVGVYIVTLPDLGGGKTDPDNLIREKGIEAFEEAISKAHTWLEYNIKFLL